MSNRHDADRRALRYLEALDAGDLETLADFWEQASASPELAGELEALTAEACREVDAIIGIPQADARKVFELLKQKVPSAFASEPAIPAPLTVAEVAARIRTDPAMRVGLDDADLAANDRLLANQTAMPADLGQPGLQRWVDQLQAGASSRYWKQFRKAALLLSMGRSHQEAKLLAARRARKPAEGQG